MSTVFTRPKSVAESRRTTPIEFRLSPRQRLQTGWQLAKLRIREYLQFDATLLHRVGATAAGWLGMGLIHLGRVRFGFKILSALHRGAYSRRVTERAERFVRTSLQSRDPRFTAILNDFVERVSPSVGTANFFDDPLRMLGNAVLVLKSPTPGQKGVVIVWYNHVFPVFMRFYDVPRIAEQYHLVLEPSWSGCCDLHLLPYTQLPEPVFVEAIEPYDVRFLRGISSNLVPVNLSFNSWVDHSRMRPLPNVAKEFDVVMMAGWGSYKRHHRFFQTLNRLRCQGHRLRVLLLGYSVGWTKETILQHAEYYGVRDQIELREQVPYDQVNGHLNRARIHVMWSRREGVNRAIIEAMFAGLPCVLREGFNYGYRYPYVNEQTGSFASEQTLAKVLLETISKYDQYSPRAWVMENMTCSRATRRLEQAIAATTGQPDAEWNGRIAVKVNELSSMRYFDESIRRDFQPDYDFLASKLRTTT